MRWTPERSAKITLTHCVSMANPPLQTPEMKKAIRAAQRWFTRKLIDRLRVVMSSPGMLKAIETRAALIVLETGHAKTPRRAPKKRRG